MGTREDIRKIDRKIRRLASRLGPRIVRPAVDGVAAAIERVARAKAPVETGDLRESIKTERGMLEPRSDSISRTQKDGIVSSVVVAGENVKPYAGHVEYGTEHMAPRPFMRPALDTAGKAAASKAEREIAMGIERAAK